MERGSNWNLGKGAWVALDLILAACSVLLVTAYWIPFEKETLRLISLERLVFYGLLYGLSFVVAGEVLGLHEAQPRRSLRFYLVVSMVVAALSCLALLFVVYLMEFRFVGRFALLKIGVSSAVSVAFCRLAIGSMASRSRSLVLALVPEPVELDLSERVEAEGIPLALKDSASLDKKGGVKSLTEFCRTEGVDEVVMMRSGEFAKEIDLVELMAAGTRVSDLVDFWERYFARVPPDYVDESWLARLDLRVRHPIFHRAKRFLDVLVALVGLLVLSPILLLASLAILLETGAPVFFSQKRVGFLGRPFTLHKLRTMHKDAEADGAKWASEEDQRITRVGKFLRLSRIDEIPQFWNVLKGEMSIVGPRPERPEFVEQLNEDIPLWPCRHLLKPGLSGWAQIRFRYAAGPDASKEKLAYDLFYLKNASILLDLQIILSTLRSVAKGSR